jgi:hypothetical protein
MECAFCGKRLEIKSAWKGANNVFYCAEFCADSEVSESASTQWSLLQHHLTRPYERLQRLLPLMQGYSGHALPAGRR